MHEKVNLTDEQKQEAYAKARREWVAGLTRGCPMCFEAAKEHNRDCPLAHPQEILNGNP
jgi:hypothetical protein